MMIDYKNVPTGVYNVAIGYEALANYNPPKLNIVANIATL